MRWAVAVCVGYALVAPAYAEPAVSEIEARIAVAKARSVAYNIGFAKSLAANCPDPKWERIYVGEFRTQPFANTFDGALQAGTQANID